MVKKVLVVAAVVVLMSMALSASAVSLNTILTGTLGNVSVNATATLTGGVWDYVYVVSPTNMPALNGQLHSFSIANPNMLAYFGAAASDPNWSWSSTAVDSIRWQQTNQLLPSLDPLTLSFKSVYGPARADCSAQNGGHVSDGRTLGMALPEPMSLVLGCLGLGSIGGLRRLRRK